LGGNSNVLMATAGRSVHIIDHNLAFEERFDVEQFRQLHICADFWMRWPDLYDRHDAERRLRGAAARTSAFLDMVPPEWTEDCGDHLDRIAAVLGRINDPTFWRDLQP